MMYYLCNWQPSLNTDTRYLVLSTRSVANMSSCSIKEAFEEFSINRWPQTKSHYFRVVDGHLIRFAKTYAGSSDFTENIEGELIMSFKRLPNLDRLEHNYPELFI